MFKYKQQKKKENQSRNLLFLGLFDDRSIHIFAIFSQAYSGCRPLLYTDLDYIDQFLQILIEKYLLPNSNDLKLTFDRYKELADLFNERNYKQIFHMYQMTRII